MGLAAEVPAGDRLLAELVEMVNVTGGLVLCEDNELLSAPAADPSWTDMGDLYLRACEHLGVAPVFDEQDEYA